ncbi:MAG TPA: archaeosortase/exosortase family protein [Thermoplasmata archaeon]|nr:archaeosortase/exosortase family protein [Thermoplasmata archaeon]
MGLEAWAATMARHRRALGLVALLVAFTGVSMVLNPTHATDLIGVGVVVLVAGAALFALLLWPAAAEPAVVPQASLGARLIRVLTWDGRLVRLFPAFGVALVVADLGYNFLLSASPDLLTEDILVLLSAAALLGYGLVPSRYGRERDFVLLFFLFLDLLLVAPLLAARLVTHNADASVDVYSWTALAPELGALLSGLGVANSVHAVPGFTAPGLTFTPVQMAAPVTLVISTACSGIYSFGIFAAAYVAFLTTEYAHPSRRLWLLLGLGFAASYVANLLRMLIIVLVGYYADTAQSDLQNLLLAHSYAGWILFLAWLALFWGLLFKFLPIETQETPVPSASPPPAPEPRKGGCAVCGEPLSPAIPAARCDCGAFYHRACLAAAGECPACHRKATVLRTGVADGN